MFEEIIKEIKKCLDHDLYISAIMLSLSIPDICGKVLYKNIHNPGKRYIKWYDEWIGDYEKCPDSDNPYISGEVVYSLRCNMYHEGKPGISIDKISNERNKIDKFTLFIEKKNDFDIYSDSSSVVTMNFGHNNVSKERGYRISIRKLCYMLCASGNACYKENKELFVDHSETISYINKYESMFY